jgi:hypothetical protein
MQYVTSTRIAVVGAAIAVIAAGMPSVLGLYITLVAAAVLLGAGFMAYVDAVDRPSALAATDLIVCSVVTMLVLSDVAVRFPSVVSTTVPSASLVLAEAAFALAIAGALLPLVVMAWNHVIGWTSGPGSSGVGRTVQRSVKRWRRLIDTAF